MKDFINYLEANTDTVKAKLQKNILNTIDLEASVKIEDKILAPSTALELAEVYEETLNTLVVLEVYETSINHKVKSEVINLCKKYLDTITDLAEVELANNGNLALLINYIVTKEPFNLGLLNFTSDSINIDFGTVKEGV